MRSAVKTGWGRRGTAAALLVIGTAPAAAQTFPPPRQRDSGVARMIRIEEGPMAVLMDSVRVLMRVFDGEPITSPQSDIIRRKVEAIVLSINRLAGMQGGGGAPGFYMRVRPLMSPDAGRGGRRASVRGWIGITTTGLTPHKEWIDGAHFVQYFGHPLVASVDRGSPAQRAGIMPGDTVIAYDGKDVVGRVINLSEMLRPDRTLAVTVRRRGETRDYPVVVAKPPLRIAWRSGAAPGARVGVTTITGVPGIPVGPGPGDDDGPWDAWAKGVRVFRPFAMGSPDGPAFYFAKTGLFGASLMTVDPALAQSIGLSPGVLVRDVAEGMAAAKAGLRVGDVVVAASGQPITSLNELQHAAVMRADQRTLTLQVIRDRKPRTINVSW